MKLIEHIPLPWIIGVASLLCLAIFAVLHTDKKIRENEEREEYERYFKRLEDADKWNRRGM